MESTQKGRRKLGSFLMTGCIVLFFAVAVNFLLIGTNVSTVMAIVTSCIEYDTGKIDIKGVRGHSGSPVTIPVRIRRLDASDASNDVKTLGFDVNFDANTLTYNGFDVTGTVTKNFQTAEANEISTGLLRFGGYDSDGGVFRDSSWDASGDGWIPSGDATADASSDTSWVSNWDATGDVPGAVVYLNFNINAGGDTSGDTALTLTGLVDDIRDWPSSGGCLVYGGCSGDINGDGRWTPRDALSIFEKYMNICPTSAGEDCATVCGDVDVAGGVTPADALCVFNRYLGKSSCLD
ncbi:hypothetical protein EPICR_60108 [Candidatus Desulfarcum epimagneticum]|uniref:Dockerin domain-containing protein n=1 Tax=uncultured Desulfobacteraceae bacterium TaxID=218296 RepID=A0A484HIK5_9BACT|nr:hypothetical protein EPICR_60108 [uncultured Desulfobacteraceae bacterium]